MKVEALVLRGVLKRLSFPVTMLAAMVSFAAHVNADDSRSIVWGGTTNGIRLGVVIHHVKTGQSEPPTCVLYVENVGSSFLYMRLPAASDRYSIAIRGLGGQSSPSSLSDLGVFHPKWGVLDH